MDELLGEAIVDLGILAAFLSILGVGGLTADYVFPYVPFIQRLLDSLPNWDDEEEE